MHNTVSGRRAAAPQIPEPTRGLKRTRSEFQIYGAGRERIERRSVVRGLIVLAVVVLVGSIARAGLDRVFVHGWWRSCADGESLMCVGPGPAPTARV